MIVGAVIGEDGGAVEGAVGVGEVEPAFVADARGALATHADSDDVSRAVEEVFAERDEGLVAHFLDERVHRHGVDEFRVFYACAVLQADCLIVCVNRLDGAVGAELGLLFGQSLRNSNPDGARAAVGWEAESCVWAPVAGRFLEDHVFGYGLDIWSCHTLAQPLALHLRALAPRILRRFWL